MNHLLQKVQWTEPYFVYIKITRTYFNCSEIKMEDNIPKNGKGLNEKRSTVFVKKIYQFVFSS